MSVLCNLWDNLFYFIFISSQKSDVKKDVFGFIFWTLSKEGFVDKVTIKTSALCDVQDLESHCNSSSFG